jgi:hypothetical protein
MCSSRSSRLRVAAKAVAAPPGSGAPTQRKYQVDSEITHSITAERLQVKPHGSRGQPSRHPLSPIHSPVHGTTP